MARFIYNGEPAIGDQPTPNAQQINVPKGNGEFDVLTPLSGPTFDVGEDLGYDIVNNWSLIVMRADSRYTEI